jgi:integrase
MSSVRVRRETGKLYFDFHFQGVRCREYSALDDNPENRRKMERLLARIDSDIRAGTLQYSKYFPDSKLAARFTSPRTPRPAEELALSQIQKQHLAQHRGVPLFSTFCDQWLLEKQVEWRQSYQLSVSCIVSAHLMPAFGPRRLDEIDRALVLSFRAELSNKLVGVGSAVNPEGKRLAPSTINGIMGILRQIMDEAALRYGVSNPCLSVKRLKNPRKDIDPFSLEEVQQTLARVRVDYRPYLTVRFFTGLRSGEVHGLRWKHVRLERREILIRETFSNGRVEYTKNDGSQRELHMSQPVYDALIQMRPDGYADDPKAFDDIYVFRNRNGQPIDNTNFNDRVWKPLLRNLGFKYRRPYQMRHTCATLWLAAGEAPEWIARQLGHSTTEMLFRTYSRFVPNLTRRDGSAFDSLIGRVIMSDSAANDPAGITIGKVG